MLFCFLIIATLLYILNKSGTNDLKDIVSDVNNCVIVIHYELICHYTIASQLLSVILHNIV